MTSLILVELQDHSVYSSTRKLIEASQLIGLKINGDKTKYMIMRFNRPNIQNVFISKRIEWAGHAWRVKNDLIDNVLNQ